MEDHLLPAPVEIAGPTSPQSRLLGSRQRYLQFPRFTLESGVTLTNVPVAFQTWGQLAATQDNALVVCHALTGSADVEDWWGPLLGVDRLFDPSRFFVVCCNVLGSPYGSASSCTLVNGEIPTQEWNGEGWWGPEFPATTVRDDVRIQKLVLEFLGVTSIAAIVGGSMGGMAVLEWPLVFPTRFPNRTEERYIQTIVPIATSARHSAWCISWAEAQRQSIYSDPLFKRGYYQPDQPPRNGLSAARMAALLTYRSRDSFESRFGRRRHNNNTIITPPPQTHAADAHNEGNLSPHTIALPPSRLIEAFSPSSADRIFSAQSYLRYQGDKFVKRFDANCYIHLTRKMDSHDVARNRWDWNSSLQQRLPGTPPLSLQGEQDALERVLDFLSYDNPQAPSVLVVSIESDGLFAPPEQIMIHDLIPGSNFVSVTSTDGHDGFLLEFEQINTHVGLFLRQQLAFIYDRTPAPTTVKVQREEVKESVFGEVEDVTRW